MTDEVETRTYEITASHGKYRVTVPAAWKITFGAIVPGKNGGSSSGQYGVRIWEAENKQRFVMDGVTSFRDTSIPMEKIAVRKYGAPDDEWYETPHIPPNRKFYETVERGWMNVDLIRDGQPPEDEMPDQEINGLRFSSTKTR